MSFKLRALDHIKMLEEGKALEVIHEFYSKSVLMYENDKVFAKSSLESFQKQEVYIKQAKTIFGKIENVKMDEEKEILVFQNKSEFISFDNEKNLIDGLCIQFWQNGFIIEERYYSGELMKKKEKEHYGAIIE